MSAKGPFRPAPWLVPRDKVYYVCPGTCKDRSIIALVSEDVERREGRGGGRYNGNASIGT